MSEKRFLTFLLSFLITLPFLQELHLLSYKEKKETRLTVDKNPKKSHFSNIWFFTQKSSKTWVWILLWATFSLWLKNETILSIFTHCEWCSSSHVIKASLTRKVLNAVLKLLRMRQRHLWTQCLKFTEKVAFKIASEASYIYISKVNKSSLKLPKKWSILASFWKPEVCGQTVLPDRSISIW